MATATLSGHPAPHVRLWLPAAGTALADVTTEDEAAFALGSSVTLTIAGLSFAGRIFRGEVYQGQGRYRIEGGAGGWRIGVQARAHQDDSGVRLSRVLSAVVSDMPGASRESLTDSATTGGTPGAIPASSDRVLGDHWTRRAGVASSSLSLLTVPWFTRLDGATYCGARPTGPVTDTRYELEGADPGGRRATIATDTPELWVPGLTFTDPKLATPLLLREVTVVVDGGTMRVEVMG